MDWPRKKKTVLEEAMEDLSNEMAVSPVSSSDYMDKAEKLARLSRLNDEIKRPSKVDPRNQLNINTVLVVLGSFAEVMVMLNYEELKTMTSKAMSRIIKPKL